MCDPASESDVVLGLAEEFLERHRRGERPSLEEYVAHYPELADRIREVFPVMAMMESFALVDGSSAAERTGAGAPVAEVLTGLGQVGDYRIIREIGRGGMGVVYEAEQVSLGRHVALKVLPPQALTGSSHLQRFRLEARVAARLHHTNIVPVFAVGEQDGLPYYAMQFIPGQGLDSVFANLRAAATSGPTGTISVIHGLLGGHLPVAEQPTAEVPLGGPSAATGPIVGAGEAGGADSAAPRKPFSELPDSDRSDAFERSRNMAGMPYFRSIARVGLQVAEALAYAHSQGILHRDIKPSNLLLDAMGTVWVTDFGLAKAEGSDALTQTGDVVGTLRYMAPERFDGGSDARSDLYSLGVTLYELLTLRPLFEESNRARLIKRVTHELPPAPRKRQPRIPRDLETIVLKAIAKEPAQRYASAEAMAEDLRRFLADRPVKARRISGAERLWRWSRRNPALAASLSSLFLVLAIGCIAMTGLWRRAERQREIAAGLQQLAESRFGEAERLRAQSEERRIAAQASAREAERQRARAQANFERARAAVDDTLSQISDSQLKSVPGLQPLRRDLLRSALRFYEDFVAERGDDPTLKAGLAAAQLRLAKIQHEIGAEPQSQETLRRAMALYETESRHRPDDRDLRDGLAQCCIRLGISQMPSDQALGQFERAITLWQAIRQAEPSSTPDQRELANTYNLIAVLHEQRGRMADSLQAHQQAFVLRRALVAAHPDDPSFQNALAATLNNIGVLLEKTSVDHRETLAMFRRAVEHGRIACAAAPEVVQYGRFLIAELRNVGASEYLLDHADQALDAFRESLEVSRRLVRENPAILSLRRELFQDHTSVGDIQRARGRGAEAVRTYRQATELLDAVPRETGQDFFNLACFFALCARPANDPASAPGDLEPAERRRHADAAMAALRQAIVAGYRNAVALKVCEELDALRERDDFKAIMTELESAGPAPTPGRSPAVPRGFSPDPSRPFQAPKVAAAGLARPRDEDTQPAAQHAIGVVQVELARLEEAKTTLDQALAARQALVHDDPENGRYRAEVASTRAALGRLAWKAARLSEAVSRWREVRQLLEAAIAENPGEPVFAQQLAQSEVVMAQSYAERALWDEAAEAMKRAFQHGLEERSDAVRRMSLLAVTRQRDALLRLGPEVLDRYAKRGDPILTSELVRCCALVPGVVLDADQLVALGQRAAALGHTGALLSFSLGLAEYRARRYEDAVRDARESLASDTGGETGPLGALNGALLAMAHFRLGRHEEARRWLDNINRLDWRSIGRWPPPESWWLRTDFLALKREAAELITGKPALDDPWLREERGHTYAQLGESAKAEAELQAARAARSDSSGRLKARPSP